MSKFISAGFGSFVSSDKILAILHPDSAPVRRQIQEARGRSEVIDATYGRKIRSVLYLEGGQIMLCAIAPETLNERVNQEA